MKTNITTDQVIDAARAVCNVYWHPSGYDDVVLAKEMDALNEVLGDFQHDSNLGYARYIAKPDKGDVYRILAREGNRTNVKGIWYPAVTYQNVDSGTTCTCTAEDFDAKFRVFDSYQDAFTWGGDF